MPSVLFVCTANICRSPMAEAILKHLVRSESDASDWRIESVGTWANDGLPAAQKTRATIQARYGIDLSQHRSRTISREIARRFDLILAMEQGHKEALQAEFPSLSHRIFLLSELEGKHYDIVDPFGRSMVEFEATAHDLEALLAQNLDQVRQLADQSAAPKTSNP